MPFSNAELLCLSFFWWLALYFLLLLLQFNNCKIDYICRFYIVIYFAVIDWFYNQYFFLNRNLVLIYRLDLYKPWWYEFWLSRKFQISMAWFSFKYFFFQNSIISFSSFVIWTTKTNPQFLQRLFCLFMFWVFLQGKRFRLASQYTQKCQHHSL